MVRIAIMAVLSPPPDQGPRCAGSLRSTPALRGFGYRLRQGTGPAVSPTFGRCASCKPGDPPPPSRPAAARASDRNRSLSRPHPGASVAKGDSHDHRQFHLQRGPGHLHGRAPTLTVAARKVVFRPIEAKGDKAPLGWRSCRFSAIPERMNHEQIPYRCRPPAEAGHAR